VKNYEILQETFFREKSFTKEHIRFSFSTGFLFVKKRKSVV